jgi:hypothetical protein
MRHDTTLPSRRYAEFERNLFVFASVISVFNG